MADDQTLIDLQQAYFDQGKELFLMFVDILYPENRRGQRAPILHEILSDPREEWRALEEIARRSLAVKQGLLQPDSDTERFDENVDNAQQRLLELRQRFANQTQSGSGS